MRNTKFPKENTSLRPQKQEKREEVSSKTVIIDVMSEKEEQELLELHHGFLVASRGDVRD